MQQDTINLTAIAHVIDAYHSSKNRKDNPELGKYWAEKHYDYIMEKVIGNKLPSGSGIDSGCKFDIENSNGKKLVFTFSFHHMNENGYYEGVTKHKCIVTPSFGGYSLNITGGDRNNIKDYLYDLFSSLFVCTTYQEWIDSRKNATKKEQ